MGSMVQIHRSALVAIRPGLFQRAAAVRARDLTGTVLLVDGVGDMVVETEAYDGDDPASHSFNRRTARNGSMSGPAGHAYTFPIACTGT
jgi:DNA-3-methyladenine glycosylase